MAVLRPCSPLARVDLRDLPLHVRALGPQRVRAFRLFCFPLRHSLIIPGIHAAQIVVIRAILFLHRARPVEFLLAQLLFALLLPFLSPVFVFMNCFQFSALLRSCGFYVLIDICIQNLLLRRGQRFPAHLFLPKLLLLERVCIVLVCRALRSLRRARLLVGRRNLLHLLRLILICLRHLPLRLLLHRRAGSLVVFKGCPSLLHPNFLLCPRIIWRHKRSCAIFFVLVLIRPRLCDCFFQWY